MSAEIRDRPARRQNHHVTAVITHRVRPGREAGYEAWIKGISADARTFPGHLGVSILRPEPGVSTDYVVVLQFDTCDHLTDWLESGVRKEWIDRVQPMIQERENIQILTGLEAWFQLPSTKPQSAPKRYKQAVLVWMAVVLVGLLVSPQVAPLLRGLPWVLQVLINGAISVVLLTYVIMPQLTQWFRGWLFAP